MKVDAMLLEEARKKVIEIARLAGKMGLVTLTFGNFSLRDRQTGYICLTPSGLSYDELQPSDIVVVDVDRNIIDGGRKPSVEMPLHCLTYRNRPDVCGVCHTHSVYATAWSCSAERFPVVVAELASLIGESYVFKAPYRPMGSEELAQVTVATLADKDAVLMTSHGVLAVGPDLSNAFQNAVAVEEGAKIAYLAGNMGGLKTIPEEECQALRRWMKTKYGQQ
jgi:L-ribulose-5-phosphate 4-epimerase